MGKLILVALGIAIGTAVAVAISAREQLDAPASPAEPQVRTPEPAAPRPFAAPAAE